MEELSNNSNKKEKFVDKSVHQTFNDSKPVGYGSSIQNSGNGNKTRPTMPKDDLIDSDKENTK
ncbi:MAG: hypothetical protein EOO43_03970 [Flavobacterium sp.]|nr:MAG: hypothetical protein EOO43_03970 [Flavobacterium sp.]